MATVENTNWQEAVGVRYASSSMQGGDYFVRATQQLARVTPPTDKTDPHSVYMWKIAIANKAWDGMRQCQKDWFNHAWKKRRLSTAEKGKNTFLQSGTYLGVNTALDTLDKNTGTYWVPECVCYPLINPDWSPALITWKFLHAARGNYASVGYLLDGGNGKNLGFGQDPKELRVKTSLRTPLHITRYATFDYEIAPEVRPVALTNWFPLHLANAFEDIAMWDDKRWTYENCKMPGSAKEECYIGHFWPKVKSQSLCVETDMQFRFKFDDMKLQLSWQGGTGGRCWDIYWADTKIGNICEDTKPGGDGGNMVYQSHGYEVDKWPMLFLDNPLPPVEFDDNRYTDVNCDMTAKWDGSACPYDGGLFRKNYQFSCDKEILTRSWGARPAIRVDTETPIYDARGWGWAHPWGTASLALRGASSPDWTHVWAQYGGLEGVEFSEGKQQHCDNLGWGYDGWFNEVLINTRNAMLWPSCTWTEVTGLKFRALKEIVR